MHPGARFSDTTHLDELDHVAQGFVHLLQSILPLLGRRAVVVAFHVDALVVHRGHLGAAVAGGGREGKESEADAHGDLPSAGVIVLTNT